MSLIAISFSKKMGYVNVVIPPDIMDDRSSDGMVAREGGNIRLKCVATGTPEPTVTWKREDGRSISIRENGSTKGKFHYFSRSNKIYYIQCDRLVRNIVPLFNENLIFWFISCQRLFSGTERACRENS